MGFLEKLLEGREHTVEVVILFLLGQAEAVIMPHWHNGNGGGALGNKGAVVAHRITGGHFLHVHHFRLQST